MTNHDILTTIIADYRPYDTMDAFGEGFVDYQAGKYQNRYEDDKSARGQVQAQASGSSWRRRSALARRRRRRRQAALDEAAHRFRARRLVRLRRSPRIDPRLKLVGHTEAYHRIVAGCRTTRFSFESYFFS
jgi:hypothetical protein